MKDETYESTSYSDSTRRSKKLNGTGMFFLVTTIVLLGAGVFLSADSIHKSKQATALSAELSTSEKRYTDLDAKYSEALSEIESYRGKNATLDSVLAIKEKAIIDMRANLSQERKKRQLSETDYKSQLTDLNSMITGLTARVDSLQRENRVLVVQKDSLGNDITQKQSAISQLQTTNTTLTQKVTVASLLIPSNIVMEGIRDKSNGKESETNHASKVQHLKICFDIPQNKVSDAGSKTFMVRILDPQGAVLSVDNQGSGVFTSVENGTQMQYTTSTTVDYQQQAQAGLCTKWSQTTPFQVGNYTAEIYQDGYLLGKQTLALK